MKHSNLTSNILGCAMKVHSKLGPGLLESAYRTCLAHELRKNGFLVQEEVMLPITYDSIELDHGYRIDIIVNEVVIIELKVVENILDVHEAQLLTYLKFAEKPVGLLLNFNVKSLKQGIKRFVM
ncbi:MAG: GxxExxY protein [Marinilabiliales bacterium]|nr:MAG: GxxExxY protein [Marinilabiliales bacterium]